MGIHKRRYSDAFFGRIFLDKLSEIEKFIQANKTRIGHHYAELPDDFMGSVDFKEIILLDAAFIIELFLRFLLGYKDDFLLTEVWLAPIRRDLWLLENQLPYFVLDELYKLARTYATEKEVSLFIMPYFSDLSGVSFNSISRPTDHLYAKCEVKIKHFTDLCRYALVEIPPNAKSKFSSRSLGAVPNVVKLKNSGVKFQRSSRFKYLVDIQLDLTKRLMSFSNKVELQIPHIEITDNTECLIRNLMALEVCQYPSEAYIHLMDSLINTEQDVDLLVEDGIIYDPAGDYSVTATMFNKLCKQIPQSYSHYNIYKTLSSHYRTPWNHAMETWASVYLTNSLESHGNSCCNYTPAAHFGTNCIFYPASCLTEI